MDLRHRIATLIDRVEANNLWRQRQCFNLIPSEMTPSLLVRLCEICDPSGRYAEHRGLKGSEVYFYQGTEFISDVEDEIAMQLGNFFDCPRVEARPTSGQVANTIVFESLVKLINRNKSERFRRIRTAMNNNLNNGGHVSSQPMGALFNTVAMDPNTHEEAVVSIPVLAENPYRADVPALKELIHRHRPELIVFGKSMFLYPEPIKEAAELIADADLSTLIMYDMAHVLGLYGAFQSPLQEGAQIVTGSTHKTFFGPQRGVILGTDDPMVKRLWPRIRSRSHPGNTSNHHLGTLLALLVTTYEMQQFRTEYQNAVLANARALAQYLHAEGLDVEGDAEDGFTSTHQVMVRVSRFGTGEEIARRLERNNIIVNYQALPDDASFLRTSGIRLGVQEMTRYGMKPANLEKLSRMIARIIRKDESLQEEVRNYREEFLDMEFCLPIRDAVPFASRILASILPGSDHAESLLEGLEKGR